MADDGGLRPMFRDRLRAGFQWTSVESGMTGGGIPDAEFCAEGVARWIEYKQTSGWTCPLKKEQSAWHAVRALRGGVSFVATRRWHAGGPRKGAAVDELWIHRGSDAPALRKEGLRSAEPLGVWCGGPAAWDWAAVRAVLLSDG